jgi:hypothetical protein
MKEVLFFQAENWLNFVKYSKVDIVFIAFRWEYIYTYHKIKGLNLIGTLWINNGKAIKGIQLI